MPLAFENGCPGSWSVNSIIPIIFNNSVPLAPLQGRIDTFPYVKWTEIQGTEF